MPTRIDTQKKDKENKSTVAKRNTDKRQKSFARNAKTMAVLNASATPIMPRIVRRNTITIVGEEVKVKRVNRG